MGTIGRRFCFGLLKTVKSRLKKRIAEKEKITKIIIFVYGPMMNELDVEDIF